MTSSPCLYFCQQPRAAHYFLLFLMQSRQHFELYFWLHVEYVLKPLLESENYVLFWKLARVLLQKAQNDSQAITLMTKNDLFQALETKKFDDKLHPPQPVAKALFNKAQQEIFVMLRSSWFDRFMKSNLYKVALKDSLIHLEREESKEDSPPKLLSRSFSALEYASRLQVTDEDESEDAEDNETKSGVSSNEETTDTKSITSESKGDNESDSGSSSDASHNSSDESEESDFSKMILNLESIIRLTNLPDGLQVHYRPHYDVPNGSLLDGREDMEVAVDMVLTFATFVEKHEGSEAAGTLMVMPVANPLKSETHDSAEDDIRNRVKAFLVPDGRILIKQSQHGKHPEDVLFPFQQSGRNGFLFGSVYLTYEQVAIGTDNEKVFVAKGICVLSNLPLVRTLRSLVENHVATAADRSDIFNHERLTALFRADVKALSPKSALSNTLATHTSKLARRYSSILNLPLSILESRVDVSMKPLFDHFGSALVLQILGSALLECSVVLVSSQYTLLTECAEAIRVLLRPFSWCHVYAPVLPKPLLSYLQCPTPILVGVHSDFASRADLPTSGFYLVADMDRHTVEFVGEHTVSWRNLGLQDDRSDQIFLPRAFETAKRDLDRMLVPRRLHYDRIGGLSSSGIDDTEVEFSSEQVRLICLELFSGLLQSHTNACLVVGDTKESVVIFDETQFLSTRDPADEMFYQALMRTQCFSEIISAHSIDMSTKETGGNELNGLRRKEEDDEDEEDEMDDGVI